MLVISEQRESLGQKVADLLQKQNPTVKIVTSVHDGGISSFEDGVFSTSFTNSDDVIEIFKHSVWEGSLPSNILNCL